MKKYLLILFILIIWSYFFTYQLPYATWEFPLTQNWFRENGLILFRDVIYHHTELPLFYLYGLSKIFGNTIDMLRMGSFILLILFGLGIYITGKAMSQKIGTIVFVVFLLTFQTLFNNFNIEEMIASLCTLYSVFFFLTYWRSKLNIYLMYAGIFLGFGIMGKQIMVGTIPAYFFTTIYMLYKGTHAHKIIIRGSLLFLSGIIMGMLPFIIYYACTESLSDFFYWNITYNLTVYPKIYALQNSSSTTGEGGLYSIWLFTSLIPAFFLLFKNKTNKYFQLSIIACILLTIFLAYSLLPSYHVYKILPFYPYPLLLWAMTLTNIRHFFLRCVFFIGLIAFLIPAKAFYINYIPINAGDSSFIRSYNNEELAVVNWIDNNTEPKEKIMNLGNHYITTLAKRLPANRYVYIFPWLVWPYETSTREILQHPPRVVIIDNLTIEDFPSLKDWRFLKHVQNTYHKTVSFGTYDIFVAKENN